MNKVDATDQLIGFLVFFVLLFFIGCASDSGVNYHDTKMDFGSIRTVAVMPFSNLTTDKLAAERVRDTFMNSLLATGVVYVIPPGEVARGIKRTGIAEATAPDLEEVKRLAAVVKADAVITGVVREYGELRSARISANVVSFSLQMMESQTQKVVWTASATKGGISIMDRLFGGGGEPMNEVTEAAVNEIISKLFLSEEVDTVEIQPDETVKDESAE